jgi:hypothetical protein
MLIAAACLAGCLDAPGGGMRPGDDGSVAGAIDGGSGDDAALPVCGDGTGLAIMHVSTMQIPASTEAIPLPAMAVFSNTGTTTIHTGQIRIASISTIGSAALTLAIADAGEELPAGESHGYIDETTRQLLGELVDGFWSDQERPQVIGTISHAITSGTFDASIEYTLGDLASTVVLTFSVGGDPLPTDGSRYDLECL